MVGITKTAAQLMAETQESIRRRDRETRALLLRITIATGRNAKAVFGWWQSLDTWARYEMEQLYPAPQKREAA